MAQLVACFDNRSLVWRNWSLERRNQSFDSAHKKPPHVMCDGTIKSNYIFSGAETPTSFRALAMVVRFAVISASRASDNFGFDGSNTFSAL
ncbi:hypothetical protein H4683_002871 [Filibacter limicola]|uniref:Uncharacterized protein n=1 Tax=Sporosarcina limicola TaxID=34101 RepID=A0A927R436_9BACL|nr:hypothetical protein [Sporosarcina limicola]